MIAASHVVVLVYAWSAYLMSQLRASVGTSEAELECLIDLLWSSGVIQSFIREL